MTVWYYMIIVKHYSGLKYSCSRLRSAMQQEYENHLKEADKNRLGSKDNQSGHCQIAIICLPIPYLTNNQSFYYLKQWTLNLIIYESENNLSYCLIWNESEGGNKSLLLFSMAIRNLSTKTVENKFLLRYHNHKEADHVQAFIERISKKQPTTEICTPWD